MKSPRSAYRAASILAPAAAILAILVAFDGMWLLAGCAAIAAAGLLINRRDMRRKGIDWDGPTTYRELRERQAARASGPAPTGSHPNRPR